MSIREDRPESFPPTPDARRRRRRAPAERLAAGQGGVLTRRQAYATGLTRSEVRADLRAGRWAMVGNQTMAVHRGMESLGELAVAKECRKRGLPEPTRQVVRRAPNGKYFLDIYWEEWQVVVEVDGIHHTWAGQVVGDALRQNDLVLAGEAVLRLSLLGLRAKPDEFFAQIERALRNGGWAPDVIGGGRWGGRSR